jgi:hypothetical protein
MPRTVTAEGACGGGSAVTAGIPAQPSRASIPRARLAAGGLAAAMALVAATMGCDARGCQVIEEDPTASPVATPVTTPTVTTQSRALELIRTRIAERGGRREKGADSPDARPPVRVEHIGDGVMRAPDLGLAWTRRPTGLFDLEDARSYCEGLSVGGAPAWRLPEIWELETVARADDGLCRGDGPVELWSATPHEERGIQTWDCREMKRSVRSVGMAQVVCVGRSGG